MVVVGYQQDLIRSRHAELEFATNANWATTNMVSSLMLVEAAASSTQTLVVYGDVFLESISVTRFAEQSRDTPISVASYEHWARDWSERYQDPLQDLETFIADTDGLLRTIGGRPESLDQVGGQYMGLLSISPDGWAALRSCYARLNSRERHSIAMTDLIQRIISNSLCEVRAVRYHGKWGEIDTPRDLEYYSRLLGDPLPGPESEHRMTPNGKSGSPTRS